MRTIKELANSTEKKVYVYLADTETAEQFVKDAMREGYHFGDGAAISSRQQDEFYAVNKDLTVNYLNSIGRMAFQSGAENIVRIDYKKYINGNDDYIIH